MTQFSPWAYPKENLHTYFNRKNKNPTINVFTCWMLSYLCLFVFCDLLLQLFFWIGITICYFQQCRQLSNIIWLFRSAYLSLGLGTNVNETNWTTKWLDSCSSSSSLSHQHIFSVFSLKSDEIQTLKTQKTSTAYQEKKSSL